MKAIAFVSLSELARKSKCEICYLIGQACLGNLRLSILSFEDAPAKVIGAGPELSESGESSESCKDLETGVFDLHLDDVKALARDRQIVVETLFSKCGGWAINLRNPRLIKADDIVVRADEADTFGMGDSPDGPLSEPERSRLLRQIGTMALVIAMGAKKYTRGEKPNAAQIALAIDQILDALPEANRRGLGDTNLRENITAGVDLLVRLNPNVTSDS